MATSSSLRRIVRNGVQNFWRNIGLSVATTFVTTLTLSAVSIIVLTNIVLGVAIKSVQERVDISVYLDPLASAEQIATVQAQVQNLAGVSEVRVVTREEALEQFRSEHADNPLIAASLEELGENPLQTTLQVRAESPDDYAEINAALEPLVDGQVVDQINFEDNRATIQRLSYLSRWASIGGLVVGVALAAITMLVVLNTVRLTIFSRREEIGIMKLVGATDGFVRGPFIIEGAVYGFLSSLITLGVLYPLLLWLSPKVETFFGTTSLVFDTVREQAVLVGLGVLAFGVLLGVTSSLLAIHRYLRV